MIDLNTCLCPEGEVMVFAFYNKCNDGSPGISDFTDQTSRLLSLEPFPHFLGKITYQNGTFF